MATLTEILNGDNRDQIIEETLELIDAEVRDKGGLSGVALKAGYRAIKGVKPGFVRSVVDRLLPEFAGAIEPLYDEAVEQEVPIEKHLKANSERAADALLGITDARARKADKGLVKKTYEKLRPKAKNHVEAALPRLAKLIDRHASA